MKGEFVLSKTLTSVTYGSVLSQKEQSVSMLTFLFCNAAGKFKVEPKTEISHLGGIAQEMMIVSEMVKICWF